MEIFNLINFLLMLADQALKLPLSIKISFIFQLVNSSFQLLLQGNRVDSHNLIATKYGF